ncbi:GRF1-interacting factor 3-like, partial [Trifolium medium]|nr:GRF1-interacting factor 3-like [Trifolium medium]
HQAQLQKNLMYLAAIPDAQPQTPALPPQCNALNSCRWLRTLRCKKDPICNIPRLQQWLNNKEKVNLI